MRVIAPSHSWLFVAAIAVLLGGCGDSTSSVEALEGVAPPAGEQGERLMAEAENAAANAAANVGVNAAANAIERSGPTTRAADPRLGDGTMGVAIDPARPN